MNKFLRLLLITFFIIPIAAKAQFESFKDSVVQLYGVVMTADSLKGIPSVSVVVKGQNRGTITNEQGVFSIVVLKGDQIEFTSIGYKPKVASIPKNLEGNQQSIIQLMVQDTVYLPATIIKRRPTREQFERDFANAKVPDDNYEIARKNTSSATLAAMEKYLPKDGREAGNYYLKQVAVKSYSAGQLPPQNIFNPFAWAEFIKAWKRGDYKRK
ncbi:MAG TPA: carboxypeptidase-like regulatory domain-containing protein [Chitinophagaceae bacterium]|nr:carboxypeptidase-like regulatory domain-containing protein [Chitinophagaceae bacterium]